MIPLRVSQGGSFSVGNQYSGRTFWLCASPKCVSQILKKPSLLRTQKRTAPPDITVILETLKQFLNHRARTTLVDTQKSGLIVHGSQRIKKCSKQNISGIIFSNDVGLRTRADIIEIYNSVGSYIFPDTSIEIGRLLRRGPRSVLALHHSRKTQSLIDTLRVGCSLG